MSKKFRKDILPYLTTYVLLLSISLSIIGLSSSGDLGSGYAGGTLWGLIWIVTNIIYGYKIKQKLQPKYKERITIVSFLLLHITFSFVISSIVLIIQKFDFEGFFMALIVFLMLGFLFAGGAFALGVKLASKKKKQP